MSIVVKRMEMPTDCSQCIFKTVIALDHWKCKASGEKFLAWDVVWGNKPYIRHSSCPLVPVPPHGDLIDRDALIRDWPTGFVKTADVINSAPTIITAEDDAIENLPSAQIERNDNNDNFEKQIHSMFDHIWDTEIDHPVFQDTVGQLMDAVIQCYHEIKQKEYRDCANAILKMWMDHVVTDGEYNRIMDKLSAHWGMKNGRFNQQTSGTGLDNCKH